MTVFAPLLIVVGLLVLLYGIVMFLRVQNVPAGAAGPVSTKPVATH